MRRAAPVRRAPLVRRRQKGKSFCNHPALQGMSPRQPKRHTRASQYVAGNEKNRVTSTRGNDREAMNRTIILRSESARESALRAIANLPLDPVFALHINEYKAKLTSEQRSLYWIRLKEVSEQAFIDGRRYDDETLHIYCKHKFLPEVSASGVQKWADMPGGGRSLKMSTNDLNTKEFSDYFTQVEAWGAELGVMYSANPREAAWQS